MTTWEAIHFVASSFFVFFLGQVFDFGVDQVFYHSKNVIVQYHAVEQGKYDIFKITTSVGKAYFVEVVAGGSR